MHFRGKRSSDDFQREKRYSKKHKFDSFLDPTNADAFEQLVKNLTDKYKKVFKDLDMEKSYDGLFQVLWHSSNPCFDIKDWTSSYRDQKSFIKQCLWKGVQVISNYMSDF